jgi:AcrR family transcriptional regulator
MARARTTEPPVAEIVVGTLDAVPTFPSFRRATRDDAFLVARATFLQGARVDMGTMAEQLAVSRATVYRWCGSREALHEQILEQRALEFSTWARAEARGEGEERVIDVLRHVLRATTNAQPVRRFMEREPKLALRILTLRDGAVHRVIAETLVDVAREAGTVSPDLKSRIDDAVHLGAVMQWATVAIDEEPDTEHIVGILRRQLTS